MTIKRWFANHFTLFALALTACADQTGSSAETDPDILQLEDEMSALPGDVLVTHASDMPFTAEMKAKLATAAKVIHVFGDGTKAAFIGRDEEVPDGVAKFRVFKELHGDITIEHQDRLAEYLAQREGHGKGISEGVGLPIGNGGLWPDSTVAFVIGSSITAPSDIAMVKQAITSWNRSVDPLGTQIKVRFVPRYQNDGRPYVQFVRGGSGGCGSSQVGHHDNIFTNWFSHNINLDCFDQATILHEMGHTAGLYHEQQRCDRDSYVGVRRTDGIDCERYCGGNSVDYGPYNYRSIMHYYYSSDPAACSIYQITPTASNYNGYPWEAGTATALDPYDVQAINQMYTGARSLPQIGPSHAYSLVPSYTSRVMILGGGTTANGAQIILWDRYAGYRDQSVSVVDAGEGYVELHPSHAPSKCYEDYGFSLTNGGAITQWDCWGGDNQKWIIAPTSGGPGYFDLINKYSGKSIDVPGAANYNGVGIQQYDHNAAANQRFALSPAWW